MHASKWAVADHLTLTSGGSLLCAVPSSCRDGNSKNCGSLSLREPLRVVPGALSSSRPPLRLCAATTRSRQPFRAGPRAPAPPGAGMCALSLRLRRRPATPLGLMNAALTRQRLRFACEAMFGEVGHLQRRAGRRLPERGGGVYRGAREAEDLRDGHNHSAGGQYPEVPQRSAHAHACALDRLFIAQITCCLLTMSYCW